MGNIRKPNNDGLTNTEKRILDFIIDHKTKFDGLSPTIREIAKGTNIKSTSAVTFNLDKLVLMGKIKISQGFRSRAIVVIGGKWSYTA